MKTISPLRYPGGKTKAVDIIGDFIPSRIKKLCSPFLGGGSLEISLAEKGVEVFAYDIYEDLVNFWKVALKSPDAIADIAQRYQPVKRRTFPEIFKSLKEKYPTLKTPEERAGIFFVLNRSSIGGTTFSGGCQRKHPGDRFTQTSIDRMRLFCTPALRDNFHVGHADFRASILNHSDCFLYLDPPYLLEKKNARLYGERGHTHKDFDHTGLFDVLKNRRSWIMSYNDCPEIKEMYSDYKILPLSWQQGLSVKKECREILILSKK